MNPPFALLAVHAAATLFMTGLIWFVQIVHYPLFAGVGGDSFAAYEQAHSTRTTWVVAPVMLVELGASLALLQFRAPRGLVWSGLALVAVVWLSTFLLQVPRHEILARGWDANAHAALVASNWLRSVAWTARAVIAFLLLRR